LPSKKAKKKEKEYEVSDKLLRIISVVALLVIVVLGVYIRLQPAIKYDYELQGDDSWEVYWVSSYLVKHGLAAWFHLDRSNPDTHIFWYPWGQDFKYVDFPLIHMFNAATYPLASLFGLSIKQWVSITPAIFGGLMIIAGYLLVRRLAGDIPALLAAIFLAFAPGTIERTVSTFAEKQGLAIPLMFLSFYFLDRTLEKKSIIESIVTGIMLGLIGWSWGGYQPIYLITGFALAVSPAFYRYNYRQGLLVLISTAIASFLAVLNTTIPFTELFRGSVGVLLVSGIAVFLASLIYYSKIKLPFINEKNAMNIYRIFIVILIAVGLALLLTGQLTISGRALHFLTGKETDPLGASVAEHQPQSLAEVAKKTGVMFIMGLMFIPVGIYYGRRNTVLLSLSLATIISLIVIFNAAYLTQFSSSILSVAGGLAITPLSIRATRHSSLKLKDTYMIALLLVFLVATASFLPTVKLGVAYAKAVVPSPRTGMVSISVENKAWYYALDYIKNELPGDAVIISWWDYGYIITAYTGKATVADGSTSNGTQIQLLAKALTATDENETIDIIFNDFKAPKNKTYLLIFDVFQSIKLDENSTVWYTGPLINPYTGTEGMGDIPKSVWMLRIGGRLGLRELQPYFTVKQLQFTTGQRVPILAPDWLNENVSSVMIYRLFINGIYSINQTAYGPLDLSGQHYFVDPIDIYLGNPIPINYNATEHIVPLKIFVDPIYDSPTNKVYVAVFLFEVR
jgi:dolichyl-diphosphooligosaccharide--protein glycosyltransferase